MAKAKTKDGKRRLIKQAHGGALLDRPPAPGPGRPRNKPFAEAIQAAIEAGELDMREILMALRKAAKKGNVPAIKELLDRTDGKATQLIGNDPENPIETKIFIGVEEITEA